MSRPFAKAFYKSKEWHAVRDYCMKRDGYACQRCGQIAEEVHHIIHLTSDNIGDPAISLNADNLMCLCRACHFKEHEADKASGWLRSKGLEDFDYVFDENGMLVRRDAPGST